MTSEREKNFRFRALFQKMGDARFRSHLDIVRTMRSAFVQAGIPVTVSGVSSPQPQIAFGPALPMNVESREEFLDFFTWRYTRPEQFVTRINEVLPCNLSFREAVQISKNADSLSSLINGADYSADVSACSSSPEAHQEAIRRFDNRDEVLLTKHKNEKVVNLKKYVRSVQYDQDINHVRIEMRIIDGATAGVHHVVRAIYESDTELTVVRDRLYIWMDGEKRSPLTLEWEQMQIQKHLLDMTT